MKQTSTFCVSSLSLLKFLDSNETVRPGTGHYCLQIIIEDPCRGSKLCQPKVRFRHTFASTLLSLIVRCYKHSPVLSMVTKTKATLFQLGLGLGLCKHVLYKITLFYFFAFVSLTFIVSHVECSFLFSR